MIAECTNPEIWRKAPTLSRDHDQASPGVIGTTPLKPHNGLDGASASFARPYWPYLVVTNPTYVRYDQPEVSQ